MSDTVLIGHISVERSMMVHADWPEVPRRMARCRPAAYPLPDVPRSYVAPSRPSVGAVTIRMTIPKPGSYVAKVVTK